VWPLKVTSGYRCTAHNKSVGGASNSRHLYGIAADFRTLDQSINPVALGIVAAQYFLSVGIYWRDDEAKFVHVDTRVGKVTWLCTSGTTYTYSSSRAFILPTISKGSSGILERNGVRMLQRLLGLTVDGAFGPATEAALMDAQEAHGLTMDGICGPASWRAISGADKYL
jgi:peptidoglycan hydrolase-like protein with peptidoglycan-binding domain